MKRVLYITNIEVPYKIKFFNELAKVYDLTVVYERRNSSNRDIKWSQSEKANFNKIYLDGVKIGNENAFSLSLIKLLKKKYDEIIISCINSPVQIISILYMKMKGIKYTLSFDGEVFIDEAGIKALIKRTVYV